MPSKFSIAGHPLHPVLVVLPVGLFAWALVADLIYLWVDEEVWYDIAFWTGWASVPTALLAAVFGIGDWWTMARKTHPALSTWHGGLNITVVALFVAAGIIALDGNAKEGAALWWVIALHGTGVALILVSGWLGGEMVYRHGLAVLPDAEHSIHEHELAHGNYERKHDDFERKHHLPERHRAAVRGEEGVRSVERD